MARPREFDEAEVLRTAQDQFWLTGYAGTSMDAISVATGLGKGSLYGAFGDKHQLFMRVFDAYCAGITEAVAAGLQGPDEQALERLSAHVRAVAAGGASEIGRRGCLLAKGTAELAGRDPEVTARSLLTLDAVEDLLASDIQAAQRHGDIDPGADPRQLAALLLAVLRGIEALAKAGKAEASLTSIAEAALAALPRPATSS
jgi:TetR/AcrR family transcriptional repressor of nem operon